MNTETKIQNGIRAMLSKMGILNFRANVGLAWTGREIERRGRDVLLRDARRFNTGLPEGFSDLFAIVPVVVDESMVGRTIGVFAAIEVKTATGRAKETQLRFLDAVRGIGGLAGIARTPAEAIAIVRNHHK